MWWEMYLKLMLLGIVFFLPTFILTLIGVVLVYRREPPLAIIGLALLWGSFYLILSITFTAFIWKLPGWLSEILAGALVISVARLFHVISHQIK